jgi:hypothetical protein
MANQRAVLAKAEKMFITSKSASKLKRKHIISIKPTKLLHLNRAWFNQI